MKQYIFIIIGILFSVLSLAQEKEYYRPGGSMVTQPPIDFKIYTTDDGLTNNSVTEIFQDSYGYMWFGTENGLNCFDGFEFIQYLHNHKDTTSLSNDFIMDIKEDAERNIWVATKNGLNKLIRKNRKFIRYNVNNGLQDNYIRSILADSLGFLWVETWGGYLHKINIYNNSIEYFSYESKNDDRYTLHDLIQEGKYIWILNGNFQTVIFNRDNQQFQSIIDFFNSNNTEKNNLLIKGQTSFLKDRNGYYYFSNQHSKGLYINKSGKFKALGFPSIYTQLKYNNQIWLGGFAVGIILFDIKKNTYTLIQKDENNINSLPDNLVWKIKNDKSGNIWIGTKNGLAKYSPKKSNFKIVRKVPGNNKSIASNNIKDIKYSKLGSLWLASYNGISEMDINTFECVNYKHDENDTQSILSNRAECLYEDLDTCMWIGYWSGEGFDRFNRKNKTFSHFAMDKRESIRELDWYKGFVEDSIGNFYPLQWGGFQGVFNRREETFDYVFNHNPFPINGKTDILHFWDNNIWFRDAAIDEKFQSENVFLKTRNINQLNPFFRFKKINPLKEIKTPLNWDESIKGYSSDSINLFAFTNNSVLYFSKILNSFEKVLDLAGINFLSYSSIDHLLFVGTNNGLYKYLFIEKQNKLIFKEKSFPKKAITCILRTKKNKLWIATNDGLIIHEQNTNKIIDKKLNHISILKENKDSIILIGTSKGLYTFESGIIQFNKELGDIYIYDIFIDENRNSWIASSDGLKFIDDTKQIKSFHHSATQPSSISNNMVYKVTGNKKGLVFIGTDMGFNTIDYKNDTIIRHDEAINTCFQSNLFFCGLTDSKGDVWFGNYKDSKSLNRYNPKTGKIKHFVDRPYDSLSYKGNQSYFFFMDKKHNLWIGSDKGLNKFNYDSETFHHISTEIGFPNNNIVSMEEDSKGNFWMGTLNGLARYSESSGEIKVFNQPDGISSNTFSTNASEKLPDGRMVFATDKGLTIFHPDSIKPFREEPNFQFTRFFIFDSLLYQDLSETEKIELQYDQNNFTIEFAALDFIAPEKQEYRYILDGYDKNWMQVDHSKRQAKYTDLPYGTYTFLLKVSNHDNYWSSEIKELKIIITPPWYLTIYAKVFYILGIISMMFLFGTVRIKLIKKRNKELEQKLEIRTKEIIEKNEELNQQEIVEIIKEHQIQNMKERFMGQEEERKRISRELHDSIAGHLTGIKLFLDNTDDENLKNKKTMLINDIDRLYNEVRNLSHDLLPPEFEETSIREVLQFYIEQLVIRTNMNIAISFHPINKWQEMSKQLQIEIYRIIQELSQNAIKHAECDNIDIEITRHKDQITIMVEDDGIGMKLISKPQGIGLSTLTKRIDDLNGQLNIDSQIGRGTIINIEIPINE